VDVVIAAPLAQTPSTRADGPQEAPATSPPTTDAAATPEAQPATPIPQPAPGGAGGRACNQAGNRAGGRGCNRAGNHPGARLRKEAELVEAFAEPGAEEGAGAAVHVREPWEGYGQMNAHEVIGRMADAGPEELAAVELYERADRDPQTVLAAADRRLRREAAAAHA
jgi:hypothetical protein